MKFSKNTRGELVSSLCSTAHHKICKDVQKRCMCFCHYTADGVRK